MIGRRVVVWGVTGSGKTGFARSLGEALGLGVVEMDAIRHARGWDSTSWDEFRTRMVEAVAAHPQGWVVDGNYSRIRDVVLSQADTVLWLRLPWRVSFWRLLKRTMGRAWTQAPLYAGSPAHESWRLAFLSRNSILWWSISHHRAHVRNVRGRIAALPDSIRIFELRSAREVEAFLEAATTSPRHADVVEER